MCDGRLIYFSNIQYSFIQVQNLEKSINLIFLKITNSAPCDILEIEGINFMVIFLISLEKQFSTHDIDVLKNYIIFRNFYNCYIMRPLIYQERHKEASNIPTEIVFYGFCRKITIIFQLITCTIYKGGEKVTSWPFKYMNKKITVFVCMLYRRHV